MDTKAYLERVLPRSGYYAVLVISPSMKRQKFYDNFDDLDTAVRQFDSAGLNTYVAVNSFKTVNDGRKQENVQSCKAFYFDIDCGSGKPYPDQVSGAKALSAFLKTTGLPQPVVISSGRGLHVYWVLDAEITPSQWKPVADTLKRAAVNCQFEIDMAVPGDSARVLRPTGTVNHKNGAHVKLLKDNPNVSLDTLTTALAPYRAAAVFGVPATQQLAPRTTSLLDNLAVKQEFPPAQGPVVVSKCQQMQWITTHQEEVEEPLWYAMLGIAAHCEEPEQMADAWSSGHPGYDQTRTITKLHQWQAKTTGPTLCSKFEELRPGGCKGCKFKDKIKTPANLGLQWAEVEVPPEQKVHPNHDIKPPKPFKRVPHGIVMTIDETDIDVCRFDIFPVSYGYDESLGYEVVRYMWNRPHMGWRELAMRQAYLADGSREFPTSIADQGIVPYNKRQTEHFQLMLRAYMDELRNQRSMTNHYNAMGWKENFSQFLLGNKLFKRDATGQVTVEDITLSTTTRKATDHLYEQAGDLQAWASFTSLLEKAGLSAHIFALGVSLSSPLYAYTGLKGVTVSLYGPTGTGKTLAQYWQQSVWGDPMQLHFTAKFTQNALFSRLALHNHLPFTIDEATMLGASEIGDFLYWVSQGRDKSRLDRSAVERMAKTWSMPVTVSTNRSLASSVFVAGLDTDAQQARLLELTMPPTALFSSSTDAGRKIYDFLSKNYGHAGMAFIQELMQMGEGNIRKGIESAMRTFNTRYNTKFTGQERYWEQAVVLADLALEIADRIGIIAFDYKPAIQWVANQLTSARQTLNLSKATCFDLISEFLSDNAGAIINVMHTVGQPPLMDHSIPTRGEIRARYDVYRKDALSKFDRGTLSIERKEFKKWLFERGGDFRTFMLELQSENADATPKSEKACLGRDTPYKLGQNYIIAISLTHPVMANTLNNADDLVANIQQGQLRAV